MNKLNGFLQVLSELNINQDQIETFLEQNPAVIDGDYEQFIININLLYKAKVPKDEIGNLLINSANVLFYDSDDLRIKIKEIQQEQTVLDCIIENPDIF